MRATGIICEYNPIHNGHIRQIEYAKKSGAEVIVCVMSGNYTQRGELAIADKYTRAKAAIKAGADVVFELPFPFSSMSAEFFARAGVYILSRLSVDTICFGHECEDIELLYRAAEIITDKAFVDNLNSRCGQGNAKGFFDALKTALGTEYTLGSNDILGAYYLAATKELCPEMNVLPIRRNGASYNENSLLDGILPSANAIRNEIFKSNSYTGIPRENIPNSALDVFTSAEADGLTPVNASKVSNEILSLFRLLTPEDIKRRAISISGGSTVLDDGNGIVERLVSASVDARSYDEMLNLSYNSKFTNSRIKRVALFSLFGASDEMKYVHPEYTTLLASSRTGREFLSAIRKSARIPIVTKPADAPRESKQYRISSLADILYASAIPSTTAPSYFKYLSPYIEN